MSLAEYMRSPAYAKRNGRSSRGLSVPDAAKFLATLHQTNLRRLLHVLGDDATQRRLIAIGAISHLTAHQKGNS